MMSLSKYCRSLRARLINLKTLDYTPLNRHVVVSFTTIPSRIQHIKPTLASLLQQTFKPDLIEINVAKTPRKQDIPWHIPRWLEGLNAVKLCWIEHDFGPASKFIPTLERHKKDNALIMIVDDDMTYSKTLLETFVDADKNANGGTVFCANGHPITENLVFFDHPTDERLKAGQRRVAIIEGCGGYAIRAQHFDLDALNDTTHAPEGAHLMDDIWISGHLSRQNIPKIQIPTNRRHSLPQSLIPAITHPRTEISNALLAYFREDWKPEEFS